MKVFEVIEQSSLLDKLYKNQRARTYEFIIAWNKIRDYNSLHIQYCRDYDSHQTAGIFDWEDFKERITQNPSVGLKFNRMLDSKLKFEKAGGKYFGKHAQ